MDAADRRSTPFGWDAEIFLIANDKSYLFAAGSNASSQLTASSADPTRSEGRYVELRFRDSCAWSAIQNWNLPRTGFQSALKH